jgi:hypothetical protein
LKNNIDSSGLFTVQRFDTKDKAVFVKMLVSDDDPYIRFAIVPKTNGDEYRQSQERQYTNIGFFSSFASPLYTGIRNKNE